VKKTVSVEVDVCESCGSVVGDDDDKATPKCEVCGKVLCWACKCKVWCSVPRRTRSGALTTEVTWDTDEHIVCEQHLPFRRAS